MLKTIRQSLRSDGALTLLSGILLGCSYPPFQFGYLATIALVPWLSTAERDGLRYRRWLKLTFLMFVVASAIELYWAGGAFGSPMRHRREFYFLILGGMCIVFNFFAVLVCLSIWFFIRIRVSRPAGFLLMPVFWVAGEYIQTHVDVLIPWSALGNAFTYTPVPAQIAAFGGVALLSFWALLLNVLVLALALTFRKEKTPVPASGRRIFLLILWLVVFATPHYFGWRELHHTDDGSTPLNDFVKMSVVQPNVNAYEKWHTPGAMEVGKLIGMTRTASSEHIPDCVIWPESAIPLFILDPENDSLLQALHRMVDSLGIICITGYDDKRFYGPGEALTMSRKLAQDGRAYRIYNGAMVLTPDEKDVMKYYKIILVPFTESIPYASSLPFVNLDFLRLNLGFDDCAPGTDTTVFPLRVRPGKTIRASALICYESAFPEFTSQFAKKGADIIIVITNDSWWGNTSGPYQHERFAVLRAIENRRWVVQCANGGISAFVDPYGRVAAETEMFREGILTWPVSIGQAEGNTFFTLHGDWLGRGCFVSGCVLAVVAVITGYTGRRKGTN